MTDSVPTRASVAANRATLQGYLLVVLGAVLLAESAGSAVRTGSLSALSRAVLGLFAVGSGAYGFVRPDAIPRGTEPAPTYLYLLAIGTTIAGGAAVLSQAL